MNGKTSERQKHSVISITQKEVAAICNIFIVFRAHCPLEEIKLQQVKSHNYQK